MGFEPTTFCAWQAVAPLADRSEYGDFECPHSRQAFGAIERLERQRAEVMVRRYAAVGPFNVTTASV